MTDIESCYECESLSVDYRFLEEEDNFSLFAAVCRECGTSWIEEEDRNVNQD